MNKLMIVSDFDGTLARTMEKSPNGIGVLEAYSKAIESIFGKKGLNLYEKTGGLKNQSPGEVVERILSGREEVFAERAKIFFQEKPELFSSLDWNLSILPEMLTRVKMAFLMEEINHDWPHPYPGVINFLKQIEEKEEIEFGIISSGHNPFISKVFDFWGVALPRVIVTDDDLRGREDLTTTEKVKPSRVLFDLFHLKWARDRGIDDGEKFVEFVLRTRQEMLYIGDDPEKDGKLAEASGVPFFLFNHSGKFTKNGQVFGHWKELETVFF